MSADRELCRRPTTLDPSCSLSRKSRFVAVITATLQSSQSVPNGLVNAAQCCSGGELLFDTDPSATVTETEEKWVPHQRWRISEEGGLR